MQNKKILITGLTGQVGDPVARALAKHNQVWGLARFSDPAKKASLERDGIRCIGGDLVTGEFPGLPADFDYVLNFAVYRGAAADFDEDMRANAEAAGLLMGHCRNAKAFLHCSSTGVYAPKGHERIKETDDLGDNHRVFFKTYSIVKIAAEAVVRYAARQFKLPTVIMRLNVPYGNNGGWPLAQLETMKQGMPIAVHTDQPSSYTLIHEDDIIRTLPAMLDVATVPARIINWAHQDVVSIEEWCAYLGELTGLTPQFVHTDRTLESVIADASQIIALTGPMQVAWKDGLRRMVQTQHPDWLVK